MDTHDPPPRLLLGLDLGQAQDYSALVALKETGHDDQGRKLWAIPLLKRWQLGTSYPAIVADVGAIAEKLTMPTGGPEGPPRKRDMPELVVDATGVGRAVVDIFKAGGLLAKQLVAVTITGGHTVGQEAGAFTVPKKDLVAAIQSVLQQRRLKVARTLTEAATLTKELQTFKVKITTAANETFECLTAGTMVQTRDGPKPIECVKRDHDVLTREGYNKVLWSGETKRVRETCRAAFSDGVILEGTPDHLIWTENRDWVELGNLTCQDRCIPLQAMDEKVETRRSSCSRESSIGSPRATPTISTFIPRTHCIVRSGSTTTGPFQSGTRSIIPMRTARTTTSTILNAFLPESIRRVITNRLTRPARPAARSSLAVVADDQGIMILGSDFAQCAARISADGLTSTSAFNAVRSSPRTASDVTGRSCGSARPCAARPTDTCIESAQRSPARNAEVASRPSTRSRSFVRIIAPPVIVSHVAPVPVYDLIVENCHEFFANGVLVHNSWRTRDHDDLVLAVAIALWVGERKKLEFRWW